MNGRFGYADDLSLLPDTLVPPLVLSQGSTAEFSQVHIYSKSNLDDPNLVFFRLALIS